MLPPYGREVGEILVIYGDTMLAQGRNGALQVHRIPEDDGGYDQIETLARLCWFSKLRSRRLPAG
jgi:hypothetical protein